MKQNCHNCSTELTGKYRQVIACAVCFEDNHINEAPTMNKYYSHEFNKIDPTGPVLVKLSSPDAKTKSINLNPQSIKELRKLLDKIEAAEYADNTIYKTGDNDND